MKLKLCCSILIRVHERQAMNFLDKYFEYFGLTAGVLIIIGIGILIFLIVAIIAERRTKTLFPSRAKKTDDEEDSFNFDFLNFDDDEENSDSSK